MPSALHHASSPYFRYGLLARLGPKVIDLGLVESIQSKHATGGVSEGNCLGVRRRSACAEAVRALMRFYTGAECVLKACRTHMQKAGARNTATSYETPRSSQTERHGSTVSATRVPPHPPASPHNRRSRRKNPEHPDIRSNISARRPIATTVATLARATNAAYTSFPSNLQ